MEEELAAMLSPGFWWTMRDFLRQFRQLFQQRRLYNAIISSSVVNLAQQLCGSKSYTRPLHKEPRTNTITVNVIAFYSGMHVSRQTNNRIMLTIPQEHYLTERGQTRLLPWHTVLALVCLILFGLNSPC